MRKFALSPYMARFVWDVLSYQFDSVFADKSVSMISHVEVSKTGVPRYFYSNEILFLVFRPSDGMFSLTPSSGRLLHQASQTRYRVVIDEGVVLKGSLLAPGLVDCWDGIRGGDEVLLVSARDELVGIGRAKMSCNAMKTVLRGEIVRVRHVL